MRRTLLLLGLVACGHKASADGADGSSPSAIASSSASSLPADVATPTVKVGPPRKDPRADPGPKLAAIALEVPVWEKASRGSRKMGMLHIGAIVKRKSETPASKEGCAGGFYEIEPRGFVCVGEEATLDVNHPIAIAAKVQPDLTKPLPYRYAFVRAVAPQYLRIPNKAEQEKSEFKLKEHLEVFAKTGRDLAKTSNGANDLSLRYFPTQTPKTSELRYAELFGASLGNADKDGYDALPPWLASGKRTIPNVATFKVPPASIFADRVRRHTGLAFVAAYSGGPEADERGFGLTSDLRLVPLTKMKPESGSPWHGIDVTADLPLPFAFIRVDCKKGSDGSACPKMYVERGDKLEAEGKTLPFRSTLLLTGKVKKVGEARYREVKGGGYVRAKDVGVVYEPDEKPGAFKRNEKWIDVSIEQQTLTLWEGSKPVWTTLVSTGQDGMKDPTTSKATVRGMFRIRDKHATNTMDSNEKSGERSEEEGKTLRRGAGGFELRDVPYVQYFEAGYALHVAYWHDVFGTPRSHGCINLSPADGLKIFGWTEPQLPDGWHVINAGIGTPDGTVISVHR